jgi:hypothetical protein
MRARRGTTWREGERDSGVARRTKLRRLADASSFALVAVLLVASVAESRCSPPILRESASPDLLADAHWQASSAYRVYLAPTMFFHTEEEASPSLTYVLSGSSDMSELAVRNSDEYPERAVPLIAEVSVDGASYHEVARTSSAFKWWRPRFPRQKVRHLRLRALKSTWLHLREVHAYR